MLQTCNSFSNHCFRPTNVSRQKALFCFQETKWGGLHKYLIAGYFLKRPLNFLSEKNCPQNTPENNFWVYKATCSFSTHDQMLLFLKVNTIKRHPGKSWWSYRVSAWEKTPKPKQNNHSPQPQTSGMLQPWSQGVWVQCETPGDITPRWNVVLRNSPLACERSQEL